MKSGTLPDVVYGVLTPRATSVLGRAALSARALARVTLRVPTRALLRGLSTLAGRVAGGPEPEHLPRKSRVQPRSRAAPAAGETSGSAGLSTLRRGRDLAVAAPRSERTRDVPRILLLNPPRYRGIPVSRLYRSEYLYVDEHAIPAMDLAYFAAAAGTAAHVEIVEANGEDLDEGEVARRIEAFRPDVIVTKALVNILEHDLSVPLAYKRRFSHVKVLMCSRSTIGREEEVFREFPLLDGILRGEVDAFAEDVVARPDLSGIDGLSTPERLTERIRVVEDLNRHPIPAFELLPRVWYQGAQSGRTRGFTSAYYGVPSGYFLTAARGCPYSCTYCMTGGIDGRPFRLRKRAPESVLEEARRLWRHGIRDFYLYDEIFTLPGHAEPISEALASSGMTFHFVCEGKPDLVTSPMLKQMKRAGCVAVYYGVESGDDQILGSVEKGHDSADARRAIALTQREDLLAGAYVMLGFPGESLRTVLRTASFLLDSRPDLVRYNFLMPYPTTVLHREMAEAGLIQFDRRILDRHINPRHSLRASHRSVGLTRAQLGALDTLFKLAFATELTRSPAAPP